MNKIITVIIVNYFSSSDLVKTLDSLKENRCYAQLDIQVIDNSCDASETRNLEQLVQQKNVVVHLSEENLGFGNACNQIYAATKTPYVFLINPDAYLLSGALDKLLSTVEQNQRIAAAGPKIFWSDQLDFILPRSISFTPLSFFLNHYQNSFIKKILWFKSLLFRKKSIRHWQTLLPLQQSNLSGGSVLLRRSAVDNAGGLFDPDYYMYFEDSDLFKRLRRQGQQLIYDPDAHIVHKFSGCAREQQLMKNQFMAKSSEVFFDKHYAGNALIKLSRHSARTSVKSLWQPELIDFGSVKTPEEIVVQCPQAADILVEWSPSMYFLPAAGLMFRGQTFHFPREIWEILPQGHQYLRIAPANKFWIKPKIWHWFKN